MKSPEPPDHLVPVPAGLAEDRKNAGHPRKSTKPWWPEEFGSSPDASGSQEGAQFAYFANALRLLVRHAEDVAIYNTRGHAVRGVTYDTGGHIVLDTDQGPVRLTELRKL